VDRRIETRVITVPKAGGGVLIERDASRVWQIEANIRVANFQGQLDIYDGFDADGKHEWQVVARFSRTYPFIPPLPCDYGIYVHASANIGSFTITWEPLSWARERS